MVEFIEFRNDYYGRQRIDVSKGPTEAVDVVADIYRFVKTPQLPTLLEEIFNDNYKVFEKGIEIRPGDLILDIGANEGMFAIMMGKRFPEAKVIAYEPVPRTFDTLCRNIEANDAQNISAYQFGVGGGGDTIAELVVSNDFSGGSSKWCTYDAKDHNLVQVHLVTFDDIFVRHDIEDCRLLKMDIEGMEYEALYASSMLSNVDYMVMEVHMNKKLEFQGRRADGLVTWVAGQTKLVHVDVCGMAE